MSFSAIKKFFKKKKKPDKNEEKHKLLLAKNLEVFRFVPSETVCRIDDVKSTLTALLLLSVHDRSPRDHQLFDQKLKSLVEYFKQDMLLQAYVNSVYSKDQQCRYNIVVKELFHTCDILSSQLRNMLFFNNRNSRIAEMTIEISQSSKQFNERREQICKDVESAINKRMVRKWSVLKTSTDKQLLEQFLTELTGMKTVMILRHQQVVSVLEKMRRRVHSAKMARSGVVDNDDFDVSAIGSQRYNDLLQDDGPAAAASSKVISYGDGWDALACSSSRGTFQDALSGTAAV